MAARRCYVEEVVQWPVVQVSGWNPDQLVIVETLFPRCIAPMTVTVLIALISTNQQPQLNVASPGCPAVVKGT